MFSPFDGVAFAPASPSHLGGSRIWSNSQVRGFRASLGGGPVNHFTRFLQFAHGSHLSGIHRFRSEAGEGERIGVDGDSGSHCVIFRQVFNDPLSGRAVLSPTQHNAVGTDFRSDKVSRPTAVAHGAVHGVSKAIKAFT